MKRLVSGITATGKLTIGNYIGAIKNFVELQNEYDMFIFVADMHALTIDIEPKVLRQNKKDIMALYLACGINPDKSTLFFQSDVSAHGEMNWIMENQTTIGELSRMTQFKVKGKTKESNGTEKIRTGLLTYPTLQAGDILLYKPNIVPVGQDQRQHIELTRDIATRFNNKYGETFIVPNHYISKEGAKIMSLVDPTKKMSKSSDNAKSYILLLDDPEVAYTKIKKAMTDSEGKVYISDDKPGITNLLTIYSSLKGIALKEAETKLKDLNYGEFKHEVGTVVKDFLIDIQSKFNSSMELVEEVASKGKLKAEAVAQQTLIDTKKKIGL
ncbi:MAG: tryptophan--tRNA ligase, partial [Mycoplasmataceae bacterium]|nr:tryptophan--tRNA ligase [Mycoplasmataceae bacterium]